MNERIGFEEPRLQRMREATLWLQRMRVASQDDRVVEGWVDWCQRDPLNQQAFDEIAAVWESSGRTAEMPAPVAKPASMARRALAASLVGLALAGAAGGWWWTQARDVVMVSHFESPIGRNSVRKLVDGSVLELGGGTRATVTLGRRARRVDLHEGEVFATVHHDTGRPFTVASGVLEVVATGTAFNVMRAGERTTVTVAEGSVAAHEGRAADAKVALAVGQQLTYSHALHSFAVREVDPAHATAWRSGMLYFKAAPISEVIASINRYSATSIVIDDQRIRNLSYTGTVRTNDIDGWLAGLPISFALAVEKVPEGYRLIERRPADRRD